MKFKKFMALALVAAMTATLAVGCGGSSDDSGSDSGSDSASSWDSSNDISVISREDGSGTRGAFVELFEIEEEQDGKKVDMTTQSAQCKHHKQHRSYDVFRGR